MLLTIQLPDDLAQHENPSREALEGLVIECYRSKALSPRQCRELLGLSRMSFEGFLKQHHVEDGAYDVEDLERDLELVRNFDELHSNIA
jgi:predicted HTH domain antitoxin